MSEAYTLYILEGCDRTSCTRSPRQVADMRGALGATGTISTWRVYPLTGNVQLIDRVEWPGWTPDFPSRPAQRIPL